MWHRVTDYLLGESSSSSVTHSSTSSSTTTAASQPSPHQIYTHLKQANQQQLTQQQIEWIKQYELWMANNQQQQSQQQPSSQPLQQQQPHQPAQQQAQPAVSANVSSPQSPPQSALLDSSPSSPLSPTNSVLVDDDSSFAIAPSSSASTPAPAPAPSHAANNNHNVQLNTTPPPHVPVHTSTPLHTLQFNEANTNTITQELNDHANMQAVDITPATSTVSSPLTVQEDAASNTALVASNPAPASDQPAPSKPSFFSRIIPFRRSAASSSAAVDSAPSAPPPPSGPSKLSMLANLLPKISVSSSSNDEVHEVMQELHEEEKKNQLVVAEYKKIISGKNDDIKRLENELDALNIELKTRFKYADELQTRVAEQEAEIASLHARLQAADHTINELSNEIQYKTTQNGDLYSEFHLLKQQYKTQENLLSMFLTSDGQVKSGSDISCNIHELVNRVKYLEGQLAAQPVASVTTAPIYTHVVDTTPVAHIQPPAPEPVPVPMPSAIVESIQQEPIQTHHTPAPEQVETESIAALTLTPPPASISTSSILPASPAASLPVIVPHSSVSVVESILSPPTDAVEIESVDNSAIDNQHEPVTDVQLQ